MPVAATCDHDRRRMTLTFSGHVTISDLVTALDEQATHDGWRYAALYDLTAAEGVSVTVADLDVVNGHRAQLMKLYGPRGPVAIAASRWGVRGLATIYGHLAERRGSASPFSVFEDPSLAAEWLDEQQLPEV